MGWIFVFLAFMFGASWASFFGVVIERTKRGETIMGRSHCTCGRQLRWYENIPVFGWLATGGKARCCGSKIPVSYVLWEIGTGLLCALVMIALLHEPLLLW